VPLLGHPPTGLVAWHGGVLKNNPYLTLVTFADICFYPEPAVVHHSLFMMVPYLKTN
jgi:hypothetical protein